MSDVPFTICTVFAKRQLARVRLLASSLRQFYPALRLIALLTDRVDGAFVPSQEHFDLMTLSDLRFSPPPWLHFQLDAPRLRQAALPLLLSHLFVARPGQTLLALSPEVVISHALDELVRQPAAAPLMLYEPRGPLGEPSLVVVQPWPEVPALLAAWRAPLGDHSALPVSPAAGWRWSASLPERPGATTGHLTAPAGGIAGPGVTARTTADRSGLVVDGRPCYLYHGVADSDPWLVTYGQPAALNLLYAFGHFNNGVPVPPIARRLWAALGTDAGRFGDPFATDAPTSFFHWLNEAVSAPSLTAQPITRLWWAIYQQATDLQQRFPEPQGRDRSAFGRWQASAGAVEYGIAPRFVPALAPPAPPRGGRRPRRPFGANVIGHFASEKGVGEVARSLARSLQASGVAHCRNNFVDQTSLNTDQTFTTFATTNPYAVNIFGLTAFELREFRRITAPSFFAGHINIAHWAWELADFPAAFLDSLADLDELWVASSFIQHALAPLAPVPVVTLPYCLPVTALPAPPPRPCFGLPADQFVFLVVFDFHSYLARKNPLGAIQAFRRAFSPSEPVMLVVKCAHSPWYPTELRQLQAAIAGAKIHLTDSVLSRLQVQQLVATADCYLSLHRAEGFGLPLAEAMAFGKPVIATGYSGNLEFMNNQNSYLCSYRLVPIEHDHGPYQRGFVWAEPDLDHAAQLMRQVYEQRAAAQAIGARAQRDIQSQLHPATIGARLRDRLTRYR